MILKWITKVRQSPLVNGARNKRVLSFVASCPFARSGWRNLFRLCVLPICLFSPLIGAQPATGPHCGDRRADDAPPVNLNDLGQNWRFDKDASKLPVIAAFMNSRELVALSDPFLRNERYPICQQLYEDLKLGTNIEVIEPEMQALTDNDPRFEQWMNCKNMDHWWGKVPQGGEVIFWGMYREGLPPYRIYHLKLNDNDKDVVPMVLYREQGNGSEHVYQVVDMERCQVIVQTSAGSMRHCKLRPETPDAISFLIHYHGQVGMVSYAPWGDDEQVAIRANFLRPQENCSWYVYDHTKKSN